MLTGLTGTYPMSCDSKGRVTLPAAHRKLVGSTVVLLPFDGCVYGFTSDDFTPWVDGLFERDGQHFDARNRNDARLRKVLMARAVTIDIDSAGRIALGRLDANQPGCRETLGLTSEVTVIGAGDHFEVWNTEKWNEQNEAFDDDLVSLFYRD